MHWRRKWQLTPVFLPGESQGWGSLMGCSLCGRTESDTTEVTQKQQQQQQQLLFSCFSSVQFSRSVVSDSLRPHRWQPTRLPRPWDSPGKNTGMCCHFLLQCMKVKSESEVAQSCQVFASQFLIVSPHPSHETWNWAPCLPR